VELSEDNRPTYVTLRDLDDKLEKVPTRWEVRFLILAGMIAGQIVPAVDIAHAAIRAVS
jgi:hypothetical protein